MGQHQHNKKLGMHLSLVLFISIIVSIFASLSLAGEPCVDKPTTGKYSCEDMANKLGLCEKSEHVRALCPKSCNVCSSSASTATQSSGTNDNGKENIEVLKNQHALEISRLATSHEVAVNSYETQIVSLKSKIDSLEKDHEFKIQGINSDLSLIHI